MKRAMMLALTLFVALVATPMYAADSYRVTVTLYPGDDAAAVAKRLAAMYRGELERPVEPQGDAFVMSIALSGAEADLLARDPQVEALEPAGAAAVRPVAPVVAAPVAMTAVARPSAMETNAAPAWSTGTYKYDGSGNIRSIGDDVFFYDAVGRLVHGEAGVDGQKRAEEYAYDAFGNLQAIMRDGAVMTRMAINPETNRAEYPRTGDGQPILTPPSGAPYSMAANYDSRGNVTELLLSRNDSFEYDALDMVTRAQVTDVPDPNTQWRNYVYNASDERIGTIILSGQNGTDAQSDWTFRDTGGQVLRRLHRTASGTWSWTEDYIYRGSQLLAAEEPSGAKHFHLDHLGSPRLITDGAGVQLSLHTYYPFGAEAGTATAGEKQFTGHERDSGTLDYMHARYYSPQMGRFLSVDPVLDVKRALANPQTWNRYSYAANIPINRVDPDGRADNDFRCYECTTSEMKAAFRQGQTAVLRSGASVGISLIPYIGDGYDVASAATGRDYIAGKQLTRGERILGAALPFAGVAVMRIANRSLIMLNKAFASEGLLRQAVEGIGSVIAGAGSKTAIKDVERLVAQHGGEAADWAKMSTSSYKAGDGASVAVHWYENVKTGERFEFKTKIDAEAVDVSRQ